MEALSEVLKSVKLDGVMFFNVEFSAPWCARSVNGRDVTSYLSPKSQQVIIFHLLIEGSGYARLEGTEARPISLKAGDILIVPHKDGYLGPPVTPVDHSQVIKQVLAQGRLKVTRMGGGGDVTKFKRGRNFPLGVGNAVTLISLGNSDGLSHTVAAATRHTHAYIYKQQRGANRHQGWL